MLAAGGVSQTDTVQFLLFEVRLSPCAAKVVRAVRDFFCGWGCLAILPEPFGIIGALGFGAKIAYDLICDCSSPSPPRRLNPNTFGEREPPRERQLYVSPHSQRARGTPYVSSRGRGGEARVPVGGKERDAFRENRGVRRSLLNEFNTQDAAESNGLPSRGLRVPVGKDDNGRGALSLDERVSVGSGSRGAPRAQHREDERVQVGVQ